MNPHSTSVLKAISSLKVMHTLTALLVAVALILTFVSCGNNDSKKTGNASVSSSETTAAATPAFGKVIEFNGAVYYWNRPEYSRLVCLKGNKETVIFDISKLSKKGKEKYTGFREIAGAGSRIYFVVKDNNDVHKICSLNLDGSDLKQYDVKKHNKPVGHIIGITPDQNNIEIGIVDTSYYTYSNTLENYYFLNIKTGEITLVTGSADALASVENWYHNGEIYYLKHKQSKRSITLYKSCLDGADKIKLGTFKTPRYDEYSGSPVVSQALYPTIDGSEYVYFSYGQIQGTGLFYGSSRVARAKLDGSDSKVIDTSRDDSTGSLFFVNEDGSIRYLDREMVYDELFTECYWGDDGIYVIDSTKGNGVNVLTEDEIKKHTKDFPKNSLSVLSAEIVSNRAFILLQSTSEGETMHDVIVNGSVLLQKDMKNGKIRQIYKTK